MEAKMSEAVHEISLHFNWIISIHVKIMRIKNSIVKCTITKKVTNVLRPIGTF